MIIKPEELKIVYEKEDDGRIRPVYSIDAVPVVRCKDCRWNLWMRCTRFEYAPVTDEDFCSKGERRTDDCN